VPGKQNSSDIATRSFIENDDQIPQAWINGPDFLKKSEEAWPQDLPWLAVVEDLRSSKKVKAHHIAANIKTLDWDCLKELRYENVIKLESSITELIRRCQEEVFQEERERIMKGKEIKVDSKKLRCLTPIIGKEDLIRVGGRI